MHISYIIHTYTYIQLHVGTSIIHQYELGVLLVVVVFVAAEGCRFRRLPKAVAAVSASSVASVALFCLFQDVLVIAHLLLLYYYIFVFLIGCLKALAVRLLKTY